MTNSIEHMTSGAVDLGLTPSRVKPMSLKLLFAVSLLDAQHQRDSVKNKLATLPAMSLGQTLNGIPHRRVVDKWLATPKRARYYAFIAFSR